jgi:hypothetical protein
LIVHHRRDCPPQLFIIMCGAIGSLKSTYAASFIFNLHRKFLFWDFVIRKRNIFSTPVVNFYACLRTCSQQITKS